MEEKWPWAACLFTNILLEHLKVSVEEGKEINYPALFSGTEGVEVPADPESFLRDVANWVPVTVLTELLWRCEKISGKKDFAYHAARAYFRAGRGHSPSLFEILVRALNDVRSVFGCSSQWGSVLTNYLNLQFFETKTEGTAVYLLAQFAKSVQLTPGGMLLLQGICEGFPHLYRFVERVEYVEELSQLQIEDVVREFPDFAVVNEGHRLLIQHRTSALTAVEAVELPLRSESVPLWEEFKDIPPTDTVVPSKDGKIQVLSNLGETDPLKAATSVKAYKVVRPGTISSDGLSYFFEKDRIYNAPYSRFRLLWKEGTQPPEVPAKHVRKEISSLLFEHLRQIKQVHTRMIQGSVEKGRLALENIRLREEIQREYGFAGMIGLSENMSDLYALIRSVAETDVTVLIQGETGTGKELIARAIHYNSARKGMRFVSVNCGALSETLLESDLFGHEKGAFTGAINRRRGIFEVADSGTLFLDEVGEINPSTQVKLLRVLQEGEFQRVGGENPIQADVRIIAATNQSLYELVKKARFREDLYYRLHVFPVTVPPLRERSEDIPLLVSHLIEKAKRKVRKPIRSVSPQAMALLITYSWPGNIRELENVILRMMIVARGQILEAQDLPPEIGGKAIGGEAASKNLKETARESAEITEKRAIQDALSKSGGNVTRAAKSLGIGRTTLQKKMKIYRLRKSEG